MKQMMLNLPCNQELRRKRFTSTVFWCVVMPGTVFYLLGYVFARTFS